MVDLSRYNLSELTPYQPGEDDFGGGSINYGALGADLLARVHTLLPEWFPAGKRAGHEFKVGNLSGEAGHSLSINMNTGVWTDFGSSEKGGADLTSLYAAKQGMSQHDAAMELSNGNPPSSPRNAAPAPAKPAPAPAPKTRDWKAVTPWARLHPCVHFVHGKPSNKWPYLSEDGKLIGYIARYDKPGAKKEFCPWTWDGTKWQAKKWVGLQPLYGMDLLARRIKDPILLVEGEKACEAARKICGDEYVCVTWPGGASGYKDADWSLLAGRDVVLWPDGDKAGVDAAKGITALLAQIAARTAILDVGDKPAKWDAADAYADGWDQERFDLWVGGQFGGGASAANVVALREVGEAKAAAKGEAAQAGPPPGEAGGKAKAASKYSTDPSPIPPELLQIPGMLGKLVDWSVASAANPQRLYSVAAALGVGSVAMGRRYRSNRKNWPSLYFLCIGRSSTGKEAVKNTVEKSLHAAGLDCLLGPGKYTSDAGVMSALILKPTHISVIDEFGLQLKASKNDNSALLQGVNRMFMESFGRLDGTLTYTGYSTVNMSKTQLADMMSRFVERPALSLVAMTTPGNFYDEVGSASLRDGFLNRILVMECHAEPAVVLDSEDVDLPFPQEVADWLRKVRFGDMCDESGAGNLVGLIADVDNTVVPKPWEMTFSPAARAELDNMARHCHKRIVELESVGMSEMYGRAREQGMRLSMIVARSCNSMVIEVEHLQWANKFVTFFVEETIKAAGANISENDLDKAIQDVRRLLAKAGTKGMSRTEIVRASRPFRAMAPRQQQDIWTYLQVDGEHRSLTRKGERGKPTTVLVLAELLEGGE